MTNIEKTAVLDQKVVPENPSDLTERAEQRLAFLGSIRHSLMSELKYTFTFPRPGDGLTQDIALKAGGISGAILGKFFYDAGESGHILRSPRETEQSFHHVRQSIEAVGVGTAILGATSVLLANRVRNKK